MTRLNFDDPSAWAWSVSPAPMLPFGRYQIQLVHLAEDGQPSGLVHAAGDGWGWTAYTAAGAVRKAQRKLAAYRRRLAREWRKQWALEDLQR